MDRHKHPRNPLLLFLGLSGIIVIAAYVNLVPPDTAPAILGFFALVIFATGLVGRYAFRAMRHAVLVAVGVSLYLFLRYLGLRQPFYVILLVASVIAIEYLWKENG